MTYTIIAPSINFEAIAHTSTAITITFVRVHEVIVEVSTTVRL